MNYIQQLGQNAARAKKQIAGCPTGEKNRILTGLQQFYVLMHQKF